MSNVTSIHDAMITRIQAVLPSATRLTNPHVYEENDNLRLKNGFGVRIGEAENTKRTFRPALSIKRSFTVVLTRQLFALDGDASSKATTEKSLISDQVAVIKDFDSSANLDNTASQVSYEGDNGIQYLSHNDESFIVTEARFQIEYFQDLT